VLGLEEELGGTLLGLLGDTGVAAVGFTSGGVVSSVMVRPFRLEVDTLQIDKMTIHEKGRE